VAKRLRCGEPEKLGAIEYRCLHWGQGKHLVALSCQSSLCVRCAKGYVDNWVSQVSQMLHEGIIYRPIVLTVPALLRPTFYQPSQLLLSPCMRCGITCLDEVWSRSSGTSLKGGSIVVIQTHGRHGQSPPHLHVIATRGGWEAEPKQWRHLDYVP
jgi:hypothetical protein